MADKEDVAHGFIASMVAAALKALDNLLLFTWVNAVALDGSESFRKPC